MIRNATERDIPDIIRMGHEFMETSAYSRHLTENHECMATMARRLIGQSSGALLVSEEDDALVGMIGMFAFPHHFSGEIIAGEVIWWVAPTHRGTGLRLFRAAEQWAKSVGAKRIQMIAPNPSVGKIYERMGYEQIETAYQRSVQ
jgi:RimJ/RimL family protein N-acetyltransferase